MPIRIPCSESVDKLGYVRRGEGVIDVLCPCDNLEVVYKSPSGAVTTLGVIGADGELVPDVKYEFKPYNRGWHFMVACTKCKFCAEKFISPETWNKNAIREILVIIGRDMESRALDFECYHIQRRRVAEQIRLFMERQGEK